MRFLILVLSLSLSPISQAQVGDFLGKFVGSIITPPQQRQERLKEEFERIKTETDLRAMKGDISWVDATHEIRAVEMDFANNNRGLWKFDSDEREYYSYCLMLAEKLDRRQITYAQFDYARNQLDSKIRARRQQLQESAAHTEALRQKQQNQARPYNCTSSMIGSQINTYCN